MLLCWAFCPVCFAVIAFTVLSVGQQDKAWWTLCLNAQSKQVEICLRHDQQDFVNSTASPIQCRNGLQEEAEREPGGSAEACE